MTEPQIVCLGLNPALDITYRVDRLALGEAQRVSEVSERAGGKAANVARVAARLGGRSHLVAAVGGPAGATYAAELTRAGVVTSLVPTTRPLRRTVTIVEADGRTTALNEAGPPLPAAESAAATQRLHALLAPSGPPVGALALSGSLPPGAPVDAYAELVALARAHGIPAIVDCAGPALLAALDAGAALVKPNRQELESTVGRSGIDGVDRLRQRAPDAIVVASDGPDGLVCAGPAGRWRARPARLLRGNPTGAGDALVAAIALGLARGHSLPEMLRAGIGASAAAVLAPVAGEIDLAAARELAATASVHALR